MRGLNAEKCQIRQFGRLLFGDNLTFTKASFCLAVKIKDRKIIKKQNKQ
jgi:hypothetical protein